MTDISILNHLIDVVHQRKNDSPDVSYTAKLMQAGVGKVCKKIGEEATEIVIAALQETKQDQINEIADLIYHVTVLMAQKEITWDDIALALEKRLNMSGLEEKAARKSAS